MAVGVIVIVIVVMIVIVISMVMIMTRWASRQDSGGVGDLGVGHKSELSH